MLCLSFYKSCSYQREGACKLLVTARVPPKGKLREQCGTHCWTILPSRHRLYWKNFVHWEHQIYISSIFGMRTRKFTHTTPSLIITAIHKTYNLLPKWSSKHGVHNELHPGNPKRFNILYVFFSANAILHPIINYLRCQRLNKLLHMLSVGPHLRDHPLL
jgi:hypothetical protein